LWMLRQWKKLYILTPTGILHSAFFFTRDQILEEENKISFKNKSLASVGV
jgi:hypothetical protein